MNCRILSLLLVLQCTILSCNQAYSKTKLNNRLFNKETSLNVNTILNTTGRKRSSSIFKTNKKWRIERVTNKQYGIINMLWQKTKIFIDRDYSNLTCKATTIEMTPDIQKLVAFEHKTLKSTLQGKQTSKPSYIEFYYLNQGDERIKRKQPSNKTLQKFKKGNKTSADHSNNKKSPIPSLFKIHMSTISRKHVSQPTTSYHKDGQGKIKSKIRSGIQPKSFRAQKPTNIITKSTPANAVTKGRMRKGYTGIKNSYRKEFVVGTTSVIKRLLVLASTSTVYDKVKFFEIYDNNTPKWPNYIHNNFSNMINVNDNKEKTNNYNNVQLLHDIHDDTGHQQDKNKTRYVKKHIQNLFSNEENVSNEIKSTKYFTKHDLKISSEPSKLPPFRKNLNNCSRIATWTEFPFVAVYIYEPAQVRCDAASISPHWLVAAASCLSRHRKGLRGGGLSAFVTFCGDNWIHPQRLSYVKRTVIHPLYHPKDSSRRLYNAGLVQVVNSMADTCSGWAPASLMSHQFAADEKGSIGTAVGWGLDRYDDSFATTDVPRHPLTIYEGRVYSRSCPGSSEYSKAKSLHEEVVRNVYCLSLPPYLAEENDTVHGALLLIGGKLLALYLKEERRTWGVQSAQYASIWRLLPWLAETAREPDETFLFDL